MRKFTFLIALVVTFLVFPNISQAEIKEGSFEINPFAGLHIFNSSKDIGNNGVYGIRLGYNITNKLGIEGSFDSAGERAKMFHADILYHFNSNNSLNPFVVAGLGSAHINPEHGSSYNAIMGDIGLGIKYFISENVAFRADIRDIITHDNNLAVTAGLTFSFGGKSPKSVPETPSGSKPKSKDESKSATGKIILEDIHFDYNKANLTRVAFKVLDRNIKLLKENPSIKVQIEGHTCAHGKTDYNTALGERRANAAKEYLVKIGISSDRITIISYGKTKLAMPEIPTPDNKESKEAKTNRRVHFEVIE